MEQEETEGTEVFQCFPLIFLILKAQGITDLRTFPWLEAPEEPATARAEQLLRDLGAAETGPGPDGRSPRGQSSALAGSLPTPSIGTHFVGCQAIACLVSAGAPWPPTARLARRGPRPLPWPRPH